MISRLKPHHLCGGHSPSSCSADMTLVVPALASSTGSSASASGGSWATVVSANVSSAMPVSSESTISPSPRLAPSSTCVQAGQTGEDQAEGKL